MRTAKTCAVLGLLLGALACEETPTPTPTPTTAKPTGTTASTAKPTATAAKTAEAKLTPEQKQKKAEECLKALEANDTSKIPTCYAANAKHTMVDHLPPAETSGAKAIEDHVKQMQAAFSNTKHELGPVLVNGDNVVFVMVVSGKNTGEMMGMKPTDKEIGLLTAVHRKMGPDGLIVEEKGYFDQTSMMTQLGMLPKEARPGRAKAEAGLLGGMKLIVAKNDQTEKDNLAAYDKMGAAFNAHKADDVIAGYADDALFRYVAEAKDAKGKDAIKKGLEAFYKSSSDVKSSVDWKLAAGDWVAAGITTKGTNDGDMPGGPKKSGKTFTTHDLELVKYEGGKVKEHWIFSNSYNFAVQLGWAPDPSTMAKGEKEGEKKEGEKKEGGTKEAKDKPATDKPKEATPPPPAKAPEPAK